MTDTQRDGHVGTQGGQGVYTQEAGLRRTSPARTLILKSSLQDWKRINFCYLSCPACAIFYAA